MTLGLGVALTGAGAGLWAIDGQPSCNAADPTRQCPSLYMTDVVGIPLVAVGLASLVTSAVLFAVDARRGHERPRARYTLAFLPSAQPFAGAVPDKL